MEDMTDELIDRFGEMPKAVHNLLYVAYLKSLAHHAYMTDPVQMSDSCLPGRIIHVCILLISLEFFLHPRLHLVSFQMRLFLLFVSHLSKTKKVKQLEKIEHCVNSLNSLIIR